MRHNLDIGLIFHEINLSKEEFFKKRNLISHLLIFCNLFLCWEFGFVDYNKIKFSSQREFTFFWETTNVMRLVSTYFIYQSNTTNWESKFFGSFIQLFDFISFLQKTQCFLKSWHQNPGRVETRSILKRRKSSFFKKKIKMVSTQARSILDGERKNVLK